MNFKKDLPVGQMGEYLVQQLLERIGMDCESNDDKYYDISASFNDKTLYVEVKLDLYAEKSGNIAIEFFNPKTGQPSGIGITKADIWAHVLMDKGSPEIWMANVDKLKKFIETFPAKRVVPCGGDDNASLYLYDKDKILHETFVRMDNIKDDTELANTINGIL